jgi:hypothetical protein
LIRSALWKQQKVQPTGGSDEDQTGMFSNWSHRTMGPWKFGFRSRLNGVWRGLIAFVKRSQVLMKRIYSPCRSCNFHSGLLYFQRIL